MPCSRPQLSAAPTGAATTTADGCSCRTAAKAASIDGWVGDVVSGFRIVSTPGHSLGHVSLLRDADGLLFTADAFGCFPRKIRVGVRKGLCADPPMAKRSAQKLLGERFATVTMAHGPVLRSDARARLQRAVDRCRY